MRKFTLDNSPFTEISTESLKKYFNDVSAIEEVLTEKEQRELIEAYHYFGDEGAKEDLIKGNLRFVISVAKQYKVNSNIQLEDLINEGNIGLYQAVENFDPERSVKFISYAVWWIRRNIMIFLNNHSRLVKLPLNRLNDMTKIEETKDKLFQRFGREPTVEEVKEELDEKQHKLKEKDVKKAEHLNNMRSDSLDDPIGDEESDKPLSDVIPNEDADDPEANIAENEDKKLVDDILSELDSRERMVIELYYGIDSGIPLSLNDAANKMGISNEFARKIKKRAEKKMGEINLGEYSF